jgi:hypothetical protein
MRTVVLPLFLLILLLPAADLGTPHLPSCWQATWHWWLGGISGYRGDRFTDSEAQLAIDSGMALWTSESPAPLDVVYQSGAGDNTITWFYPEPPQDWPGDEESPSYEVNFPPEGIADRFEIYLRGWWAPLFYIPWNVRDEGQEYYDVSSVLAHEFGHVLFGYSHFGSGIMSGAIHPNEVFTELGLHDRNALNNDYGFCDDVNRNNYRFYFDPYRLAFDMTVSQALRNQFYDFEIEWNVSGANSQTRLLSSDEWIDLKNSGSATINLALGTCPAHQNVNINLRPNLFCQASLSTYLQRTLCPAGCPCQVAIGCKIIDLVAHPNSQGGTRIEWDAKDFDEGIQFDLYRSKDGGITFPDLIATFSNPGGGGTFHFSYVDNGATYNYQYSYRIRDWETDGIWGPVYSCPGGSPAAPPVPGNSGMEFAVEYVAANTVKIAIGTGELWSQRYELYYNKDSNGPPYEYVITNNNRNPFFIVDGLVDGSSYYFNLVGCNNSGCGPLDINKTVVAVPVATPQNLMVVPYYEGLKISWDSSVGAVGYYLQYKHIIEPGGGEELGIDLGSCNEYDLMGLENRSQYQISLCAYDSYGNRTQFTDCILVRTPGTASSIELVGSSGRERVFCCFWGDVTWHPCDLPDSVWATFNVKDMFGNPIRKMPAEKMKVILRRSNTYSCGGDTIAALYPTDMDGKGTIWVKHIAGADSTLRIHVLVDSLESPDSMSFYIKSTNLNGDNKISLSDFVIWSISYQKSRGQPGYNDYCDFTFDGKVNLSDFGFFGSHYHSGSGCP